MDSDALLTFLTVHRRGGISSAAKTLHRSQPAISRRIALLEQELGVPLFERIAGRTMLSDAGRVMVPYAERAVAAAQDARMRFVRWRGRILGRLRSRWSARWPAGGCRRS
jgi:DNA-binding transcriptional LysR family regulator